MPMAHYRQTIRDAVKARLLAAATLAGGNVFTSRARPVLEILQRREAVLSIYTSDETSERSPDGYTLERRLVISIEGMAGGGDDLDDELDNFAAQVEAAIDADPRLGNLLSDDMTLTDTTSDISARGGQQVGAFRMDFEAAYITERGIDAGLGPEPPIPTSVAINGTPTPAAYVEPLDDARLNPPDLVPHEITPDAVAPSRPPLSRPKVCDTSAWPGDPE